MNLLQDCVALLVDCPYRSELFKQLMTKIENADSPVLQLYLKVMVSVLSCTDQSEEAMKSIKKSLTPVLSRLVQSLTKVN